jgi:hypothetical protein
MRDVGASRRVSIDPLTFHNGHKVRTLLLAKHLDDDGLGIAVIKARHKYEALTLKLYVTNIGSSLSLT